MSPTHSNRLRLPAACLLAFAVLGALDAAWLGVLARDFYQRELGPLMGESVRLVPAALYYLGYPLALVLLALAPANRAAEAVWRSALLGLTAFGVYDLTNLATLRGFSVTMAAVDMAWGTFASALAGGVAYRFARAPRR